MEKARPIKPIYLILAISLLLRLLIWFQVAHLHPERLQCPDSRSYRDSALALLESGRFSVSPEQIDLPQTVRTPGYPIILWAVYKTFGISDAAAALVQLILGVGLIALVYALGLYWGGRKVGTVSALLLALDPLTFTYSLKVLSDLPFTVLIAATVGLLFLWLRERSLIGLALAAGGVLTLATLVRPISYYLFPLLIAWMIGCCWIGKIGWKQAILAVAAFSLPFCSGMGLWQWRNYSLTGSSTYCSADGYNLLFYHGAGIMARRDGLTFDQAIEQLGMFPRGERYRELHPETRHLSFNQLSDRWTREGLGLIQSHLGIFALNHLEGIRRVLTRPGLSRFWGLLGAPDEIESVAQLPPGFGFRASLVLGSAYLLFVYVGCLRFATLALQSAFRKRSDFAGKFKRAAAVTMGPEVVLILLLLCYLLLLTGGPPVYHESTRYRLPMMPWLTLLASAGWLIRRARNEASRIQTLPQPS